MKRLWIALLMGGCWGVLPVADAAHARGASTSPPEIRLAVLYDNHRCDPRLDAQWGFACLVTGTEKTILFDTGGKGPVLLENMSKMNVAAGDVETVVISHSHGDHTGGLLSVLEQNARITVYLPPSCPKTLAEQARSRGAKVVVTTAPAEVCKGVFLVGPIGDTVVEQALAVATSKGPVVVTGCAHPGIVEIVAQAKRQLNQDVYMVCGGMHLLKHSDDEVQQIIARLRQLGVQRVGPTHCTGDKAIALFKEAFGQGCVPLGVGRVVGIPGTVPRAGLSLADALAVLRSKRFVDLTHAFEPGIPHWQGFPDEKRVTICGYDGGTMGRGFFAEQFTHVGQWGTHCDPPAHFVKGKRTLDQIDPKEMVLPLVVIDVHRQAAANPDYAVTMADVQAWQRRHGPVPKGAFVALRTDWSKRWPDAKAMRNEDARGIAHYPGWSLEVLKYLYQERGITASGHETTDTDPGVAASQGDYALESYVLGSDHYQIELLANLDRVPEAGAIVVVAFPKPKGGSGFPARVFAIVP